MEPFYVELRRHRRAADLTQEQLAELVGCAVTTIRALETGRRRPSRELAERLAKMLAVPDGDRAAFVRLARLGDGDSAGSLSQATAPFATLEAQILGDEQRRYRVTLPANRLIGRHRELALVRQHLANPEIRLVTLVGPGGIGKTRLALQAAADVADTFAYGAALVPLGSVASPANVPGAIAEALGLTLSGVAPPEADLATFLRERELLLLLDTLEHLLGGEQGVRLIGLLTTLLAQAPRLRLLVTSRERLRIRDEWIVEVDSLTLPGSSSHLAIAQSDAVTLFIERAQQAGAQLTLTTENRQAVAQLCRTLSGMPLAIELAAAWVHVLSCDELAREIAHNQELLTSSARDIPSRHRSLQAAFDYSWGLLNADERRTLRRLAVFRGPFSRQAAMAVLVDEPGHVLPTLTHLALLASLIDKSLLRSRPPGEPQTSYELHEQIRQYAEARLRQDAIEHALARRLHAAFYAAWADQQEPRLKSADQRATVAALGQALDSLRSAWEWAIEQQEAGLFRQMCYTLGWFAELQGRNLEFAELCSRGAAALAPRATGPGASRDDQIAYWLLTSLEGWATSRFAPARAVPLMHAALEPLRHLGDDRALFQALITPAYVAIFAGDHARARALLDEALEAARRAGSAWGVSTALVIVGLLEVLHGEAAIAQRRLTEGLQAARACGDPRLVSFALNYSGRIALSLGDPETAERCCREALTTALAQRDRYQSGLGLLHLGQVAQARADHPAATWLLQEALVMAVEISDRWLEAQVLGAQGRLAAAGGDRHQATALLVRALTTSLAAPTAVSLDLLADLAECAGEEGAVSALAAFAYLKDHQLSRPATSDHAARLLATLAAASDPVLVAEAEALAAARAGDHPATFAALFVTTPRT